MERKFKFKKQNEINVLNESSSSKFQTEFIDLSAPKQSFLKISEPSTKLKFIENTLNFKNSAKFQQNNEPETKNKIARNLQTNNALSSLITKTENGVFKNPFKNDEKPKTLEGMLPREECDDDWVFPIKKVNSESQELQVTIKPVATVKPLM